MDLKDVSQAEKLGMEPEEYYQEYIKISTEKSAYVVAYIESFVGEPTDNIEAYTKETNQLLNDLVEEYKEKIEILID